MREYLIGKRWGETDQDLREELLAKSSIWGNVEDGECIYDLAEDLSVPGYIRCIKTTVVNGSVYNVDLV